MHGTSKSGDVGQRAAVVDEPDDAGGRRLHRCDRPVLAGQHVEPVGDVGQGPLDHLRVDPFAVVEQVKRRVFGIDVEVGGQLADLQRKLAENDVPAVLRGDFVGKVDGQDGGPAAAGDAGNADRLVLGRRVAELLGDAIHRRLEVVRLNRQRHDLRRARTASPRAAASGRWPASTRAMTGWPGNTPTNCRSFGSWSESGTCMTNSRGPPVIVPKGRRRRIHIGVLAFEGGLLVDQHAQHVSLHTVLTADRGSR